MLHSFLWLNNFLLYCIYHILFTHLWMDRHLGNFHFLAIMNNASMDIVYKFLCGHTFSILWGIYLNVELLGHVITLCLAFWGIVKLFSKEAVPFYIPTINIREFLFLHLFLPMVIIWLPFFSMVGIFTCTLSHFIFTTKMKVAIIPPIL